MKKFGYILGLLIYLIIGFFPIYFGFLAANWDPTAYDIIIGYGVIWFYIELGILGFLHPFLSNKRFYIYIHLMWSTMCLLFLTQGLIKL